MYYIKESMKLGKTPTVPPSQFMLPYWMIVKTCPNIPGDAMQVRTGVSSVDTILSI
jgi:hypothetical protein